MAKFKHKPVEVDADQYQPFANIHGVTEVWEVEGTGTGQPNKKVINAFILSPTGQRVAIVAGDWIVKEAGSEHFIIMKPAEFDATYEQKK